ncbi:hypothetical protein OC845_006725 [Tilletia horrida]|nr:hypothetical protein OC845_006725 [Tilletia horrida]
MAIQQQTFKKGPSTHGRGNGKANRGHTRSQFDRNSKSDSKRTLCYGCGSRDHLDPISGPICWKCHEPGDVQDECDDKAAAAVESYPNADDMLAAMVDTGHLAVL